MTLYLRLNLAILFSTIILTCTAQSDAFNNGVAAYNQNNYVKAIEIYQSIYDTDIHSYELLFNLGMSHLKNGNIGESILFFEKAKLYRPHNETLDDMLALANEEVKFSITKIPDFILLERYRALASSLSSNTWAIFQIVFLLFFCLSLYFILFRGWTGKWLSRVLPFILLFLSILCLTNSQFVHNSIIDSQSAIVMEVEAYLYEGADERSEVIANVSEGVKVYILDQVGEWYKVQLEDKDVGWIPIKKVTII